MVILPDDTFHQRVIYHITSLPIGYLTTLICGGKAWGVCHQPARSAVTSLAVTDQDTKTYSLYTKSHVANIEDRISTAISLNPVLSFTFFNDNGASTGLLLNGNNTTNRFEYIPKMIADLVEFRNCILWSPDAHYFKLTDHDIPYLLVGLLDEKGRDDFFMHYSEMNEPAMTYLFMHVEEIILTMLRPVTRVPRYTNSISVISALNKGVYAKG